MSNDNGLNQSAYPCHSFFLEYCIEIVHFFPEAYFWVFFFFLVPIYGFSIPIIVSSNVGGG